MLFTKSTRLTTAARWRIETNGHPSDQWGWAVGAGLHINIPIPGDYIEGEVNYSQGATKYDMGPTPPAQRTKTFRSPMAARKGSGSALTAFTAAL